MKTLKKATKKQYKDELSELKSKLQAAQGEKNECERIMMPTHEDDLFWFQEQSNTYKMGVAERRRRANKTIIATNRRIEWLKAQVSGIEEEAQRSGMHPAVYDYLKDRQERANASRPVDEHGPGSVERPRRTY